MNNTRLRPRAYHTEITHPHPAPGLGLGPETWFPSSGLPSHCPNDVRKTFKRRAGEEGGREEARPDSLPSLPLPVLCKHEGFAMSSGGGKTLSRTCPRLDVRCDRFCQSQAHDPSHVLLSVPLPPAVPSRTSPRATPWGSPPSWGHPPAPMAVTLQGQLHGELPLLRLVPPCRVVRAHLGKARHSAHAHTHKTNPKSGSVSERINYWLMHIQMRNSAEPGGSSAPGAALERRIPLE